MGLPGSGKTTLAYKLKKDLKADWVNADQIRKKYNDWDFTKKGVLRQAKRMRIFANKTKKKFVIADFICPYNEGRKIFKPDYLIWMDTIKKGRLPTFDLKFQKPKKYHMRVSSKDADLWKLLVKDQITKYRWNNKKPTSQMLGRYQPWHLGHRKLFEKVLKKTGQVNIQVKDVHGLDDNPFTFQKIKNNISRDLKIFGKRYKISKVPNIVEINYGRKVGYKINQIKLSNNLHKISATGIRKKMRKKGLLKK